MSIRIDPKQLATARQIVSPPVEELLPDRNFELPARLYAVMAGLLFGAILILAIGLADPGLIVPMAINFTFLTAFFAVPVLFVRVSGSGQRSMRWTEFTDCGIQTATGHCSAREASILVLLLPAFILLWAIAIVFIAATV